MEKRHIIETGDGSHTIYDPVRRATFHSHHGAIAESRHVFIEKGLRYAFTGSEKPLNVLEVGMGTGLNVLLTVLEADSLKVPVYYEAIEPEPLTEVLIEALNYAELLNHPDTGKYFKAIHAAQAEEKVEVSPYFSLCKKVISVERFKSSEQFDVIYFDAFAPTDQPEMWQSEVFSLLFKRLKQGGVLTTFCAQGKFKRTLQDAGFRVESPEGPPGKREMVRGVKD